MSSTASSSQVSRKDQKQHLRREGTGRATRFKDDSVSEIFAPTAQQPQNRNEKLKNDLHNDSDAELELFSMKGRRTGLTVNTDNFRTQSPAGVAPELFFEQINFQQSQKNSQKTEDSFMEQLEMEEDDRYNSKEITTIDDSSAVDGSTDESMDDSQNNSVSHTSDVTPVKEKAASPKVSPKMQPPAEVEKPPVVVPVTALPPVPSPPTPAPAPIAATAPVTTPTPPPTEPSPVKPQPSPPPPAQPSPPQIPPVTNKSDIVVPETQPSLSVEGSSMELTSPSDSRSRIQVIAATPTPKALGKVRPSRTQDVLPFVPTPHASKTATSGMTSISSLPVPNTPDISPIRDSVQTRLEFASPEFKTPGHQQLQDPNWSKLIDSTIIDSTASASKSTLGKRRTPSPIEDNSTLDLNYTPSQPDDAAEVSPPDPKRQKMSIASSASIVSTPKSDFSIVHSTPSASPSIDAGQFSFRQLSPTQEEKEQEERRKRAAEIEEQAKIAQEIAEYEKEKAQKELERAEQAKRAELERERKKQLEKQKQQEEIRKAAERKKSEGGSTPIQSQQAKASASKSAEKTPSESDEDVEVVTPAATKRPSPIPSPPIVSQEQTSRPVAKTPSPQVQPANKQTRPQPLAKSTPSPVPSKQTPAQPQQRKSSQQASQLSSQSPQPSHPTAAQQKLPPPKPVSPPAPSDRNNTPKQPSPRPPPSPSPASKQPTPQRPSTSSSSTPSSVPRKPQEQVSIPSPPRNNFDDEFVGHGGFDDHFDPEPVLNQEPDEERIRKEKRAPEKKNLEPRERPKATTEKKARTPPASDEDVEEPDNRRKAEKLKGKNTDKRSEVSDSSSDERPRRSQSPAARGKKPKQLSQSRPRVLSPEFPVSKPKKPAKQQERSEDEEEEEPEEEEDQVDFVQNITTGKKSSRKSSKSRKSDAPPSPRTPGRFKKIRPEDRETPIRYRDSQRTESEEEEDDSEEEGYDEDVIEDRRRKDLDKTFHESDEEEDEEDEEDRKEEEMLRRRKLARGDLLVASQPVEDVQRKRIVQPPLRFWVGEKMKNGMVEKRKPEEVKKETKPKKRTATKKKQDPIEETNGEYPVYDFVTDSEKLMTVARTKGMLEADKRTVEQDNNRITIFPGFHAPDYKTGVMIIDSYSEKPLSDSRDMNEVFHVISGILEVTISDVSFRVSAGSTFRVPPHNSYMLVNPNKLPSKVVYMMTRIESTLHKLSQDSKSTENGADHDDNNGEGEVSGETKNNSSRGKTASSKSSSSKASSSKTTTSTSDESDE